MRQIRSVSADLLVVAEAAFVPRDIWTSALPTIAERVRAGGKVNPREHALAGVGLVVPRVPRPGHPR